MARGKLIVIYGINNLGKTTQARLLVEALRNKGVETRYLKYPLYDLEPSGSFINEYLRNGNPQGFSSREFQLLQIMNRTQYDAELRSRLENGEWIVAEDYVGTGIAWGMGAGVDRALLEQLNRHLREEDRGILFEGKRFLEAQESNHHHESNHDLTEKVREAHRALGVVYGWLRVDANEPIERVQTAVWKIVANTFRL